MSSQAVVVISCTEDFWGLLVASISAGDAGTLAPTSADVPPTPASAPDPALTLALALAFVDGKDHVHPSP
ncbi:hypothetical protein BZ335_23335 [Salmonella enterica subsp. enterica serovar Enteritidis]|nr:hypothetical protein [Salmonella enterica subsp. enterica serovar Enteritidis]